MKAQDINLLGLDVPRLPDGAPDWEKIAEDVSRGLEPDSAQAIRHKVLSNAEVDEGRFRARLQSVYGKPKDDKTLRASREASPIPSIQHRIGKQLFTATGVNINDIPRELDKPYRPGDYRQLSFSKSPMTDVEPEVELLRVQQVFGVYGVGFTVEIVSQNFVPDGESYLLFSVAKFRYTLFDENQKPQGMSKPVSIFTAYSANKGQRAAQDTARGHMTGVIGGIIKALTGYAHIAG